MEASIKIVAETWRKNKKGLHTVKLRVTHNRKPCYYSIKNYLKNDDWNYCQSSEELDKILNPSKGRKSKIDEAKRQNYEAIVSIATDIINKFNSFSFGQFEEKFLRKPTDWDYASNAFEEHLRYLKDENRIGYATSIQSTLTAIKYFCERKPFPKGVQSKDHKDFNKYKNLKFIDITPIWLNKFEKFLLDSEKSLSTIGIYTRNIRVIYNLAINEHKVYAEYPFNKYKPKTATNKKRALSIEQINLIAGHKAIEGTPEQFAKDMFVFSFIANGMNLTDIFRLKHKNIVEDQIIFNRFKTKNKSKSIQVQIPLTENLKQIIKRHGIKGINQNVYIFPTLAGVNDEMEAYRLIKQKTKQINSILKKIALSEGIEPAIANNISTYYARHSYATISKNSGESVEFIKESLGHSSTATTEKYLSSFGFEHQKKASDKLDKQIVNL